MTTYVGSARKCKHERFSIRGFHRLTTTTSCTGIHLLTNKVNLTTSSSQCRSNRGVITTQSLERHNQGDQSPVSLETPDFSLTFLDFFPVPRLYFITNYSYIKSIFERRRRKPNIFKYLQYASAEGTSEIFYKNPKQITNKYYNEIP